MNKKVIIALICILLVGNIFSMAYTSNQDENWTFVGDKYYTKLPIVISNPILVKHLQESDYMEIQNALIDKNTKEITKEEMNIFKEDPNAVMVDNILPNGRYMKENWQELQSNIIEDKMEARFLNGNLKKLNSLYEFDVKVKTSMGDSLVKLQKITNNEHILTIPKKPDDLSVEFILTPDGQKSLIASDYGLWLVNNETNKLEQISSNLYNGKTYEELAEKSINLYQENIIEWNGGVIASPDSNKLVYISRKNDIETMGNAIFVFDLMSNTETMIANTTDADYYLEGWINNDYVLCRELKSDGIDYVVFNLEGEQIKLNLKGDIPFVYAVQNDMIAYAPKLDANEIYIVKFNKTSIPQEVRTITMGWQTRLRLGINGFNPNNSRFACIYIPENNHDTRYVKIVDLNSDLITKIDIFPKAYDNSAYILEFSWFDNDTLLIIIGEDINGIDKQSTWLYNINGGGKCE